VAVETESTAAQTASAHVPVAKLTRPALPTSYVPRPTVSERLDESFSRRLTTVVAGPGFGKSTVVAAWSAELESGWYTIDVGDRSLAAFAAGLAAALRLDDAALTAAGRGDDQARSGAVASLLCELLETRLETDFFLVLDDAHELPRGSSSARLIEALCRQAPPLLHMVLCSRTEPPFPVERLRGQGQVLALEPAALAFSESDVTQLLRRELGSGGLARRLHELTAGWPAAVKLAVEALAGADQSERERMLQPLSRPAQEVFSREPAVTRDFLATAALFDRVSVDLCRAVGLASSEPALRALAERALVIRREGGSRDWFSLHPLIREFALERWPIGEVEARRQRRKAAAWFEREGHFEDCLLATAAASDGKAVARLLAEHGWELLWSGRVDTVLACGEHLSTALRTPMLEVVLGTGLIMKSRREDALLCLERAVEGTGPLPAGIAWRAGEAHHRTATALAIYRRGEIEDGDQPDEAILLEHLASASFVAGDAPSCGEFARRSFEVAQASRDSRALAHGRHALALAASISGDRGAAVSHYTAALAAAEAAGATDEAIKVLINLAIHAHEYGRYEEALEKTTEALRRSEVVGSTGGVRWALARRSAAHLALGRVAEALSDAERSLELARQLDSPSIAVALIAVAEAHAERGDVASARAAYGEAVRRTDAAGDIQLLQGAMAGLARMTVGDDPGQARELADRAIGLPRTEEYGWALCSAGWIALGEGEAERARRLGSQAAHVAGGTAPSRGAFAEALELTAVATGELVSLEEALLVWRELGNPLRAARAEYALGRLAGASGRTRAERAKRGLQRLGVRPEGAARAAGLLWALGPERPVPLAIHTLGAFGVVREGHAVPLEEWQSRKARDLVKLLVARRGRPVPREALIEALWPGQDPKKTANRLSVALSTARSVLDPGRRFDSERYLHASSDAVALVRGSIVVDVEAFLADAEAGLAASRGGAAADAAVLLEAAEAAYTGDFLEEDPYEDWAAPLREEARAAYIAVADALAGQAAAANDHQGAIRYRLRVLERDRYDEGAHLGLISALTAGGRHGEARRVYRSYAARMDEIGVEPAPFPAA
jgi:ATP/maltotriose-dependent transcriptional regulator MalT/DNA-binding SARP family transcriptional activator